MALEYFISHKNPIAVVAFKGAFARGSEAILENCFHELQGKNPGVAILHMAGAGEIHHDMIRPLFLFLKNMKTAGIEVVACDLSSKLREQVLKQGLFTTSEIDFTLQEALLNASKSNREGG